MEYQVKDQIIYLRKQLLTYEEIKEKLGCEINIISKYCKEADLTNLSKLKTPNAETIGLMQKEYNKCKSSNKVAKKFGYSKFTVLKYINIDKRTKLTEAELKSRRSKSVIDFRRRVKLDLIEYKGGECQLCGYSKCSAALEFHHKDPSRKDFTISGKSWGFDKLKKEVEKCVLVCSNCHSEIHAGITKIQVYFKG